MCCRARKTSHRGGLDVPGLKGLFFFRNNMTPLVHLTQYLGLVSQGEVHDQHLLVCGTDDACVGFLVDGIRGILLSEWQTTSKQETGYHMVNVVDRGNTWLCPRLPLEALAIEVMRNLSRLEKDIAWTQLRRAASSSGARSRRSEPSSKQDRAGSMVGDERLELPTSSV